MKFFRDAAPLDLPLSMAGIKLGDRVLVVGCEDPTLVAGLALKTGLTGRACAIDADESRRARADAIVTREGALVDIVTAPWTALPYDADSFDIVVVRNVLSALPAGLRSGCVQDIQRVLRPGGRCLIIDGAAGGLLARLTGGASRQADYSATHSLDAAGFRAVRTLAERSGLRFVEGVRANS